MDNIYDIDGLPGYAFNKISIRKNVPINFFKIQTPGKSKAAVTKASFGHLDP